MTSITSLCVENSSLATTLYSLSNKPFRAHPILTLCNERLVTKYLDVGEHYCIRTVTAEIFAWTCQ